MTCVVVVSLPAEMGFFVSVVLFVALAPLSPVKAGKCPKLCSCDNSKLTVICAGKNLTEVPLTVNEVIV